jgi:hypothetical protein
LCRESHSRGPRPGTAQPSTSACANERLSDQGARLSATRGGRGGPSRGSWVNVRLADFAAGGARNDLSNGLGQRAPGGYHG